MSIEVGAAAYSRMSAMPPTPAKAAAKAAEEPRKSAAGGTDTFTRTVSDDELLEASASSGDSFTRSEDAEAAEGGVYSDGVRYAANTELVEHLKGELEQRMANLVQMMLGKQLDETSDEDLSYMWNAFRTGNFEATEEEILQAQKDTAEDGYWGVEQTSDRIVKFAVGLTGGDPDKLDSMIEAFEKGYAEAEKTWGGELPELSRRTREAVLEKFKKLKEGDEGETAAAAQQSQTLLESAAQKAMGAIQ